MTLSQLQQYAKDLDSLKKPYENPLSGMLSYVDGLNGHEISKKFFPNVSSLVNEQAVQRAVSEMTLLQARVQGLCDRLKDDESLTLGQKGFLENAMHETIIGYDLLILAVWIEAEKGGLPLDNPDAILSAIEDIEMKLYGPRVRDVPEERDAVISAFADTYERRGCLLPEDDQNIFSHFLSDMGEHTVPGPVEQQNQTDMYGADSLWEIFSRVYEIYGETPCRIHFIKGENITPYYSDNIHHIPAKRTVKQKEKYYIKHGIASHAKICFSDTAANVSVGYNQAIDSHSITFPVEGQYSWQRVCELMDHEIGTHYSRNKSSGRGAAVRSAGYLQTEEGMAMANEAAVTVLHLDDLTAGVPTIHHLSTFVGENYNYDQTLAILRAYYIMEGKIVEDAVKEAKKRAERVKRFHANYKPGANRKDVVYRRGKRQVVDFLQHATLEELQVRRDLMYQGKFSEADKGSIESLLGNHKPDFKMPYALGKILYQRSLGVKMDELRKADSRFQLQGDILTTMQKRKMIEILSIAGK